MNIMYAGDCNVKKFDYYRWVAISIFAVPFLLNAAMQCLIGDYSLMINLMGLSLVGFGILILGETFNRRIAFKEVEHQVNENYDERYIFRRLIQSPLARMITWTTVVFGSVKAILLIDGNLFLDVGFGYSLKASFVMLALISTFKALESSLDLTSKSSSIKEKD